MSSLRIIVSGLAGLEPVGGMAWHYLQYVLGLSRLGHEVIYHEDTWTWPFNPIENQREEHGEYSARFVSAFFEKYAPALQEHWHYFHLHSKSYGMSASEFGQFARTADVFLNVSGANFIPEELAPNCIKVFIDTDPGYNQVVLSEKFAWSEYVERWRRCVSEHDMHLTFGENINGTDCLVPKLNLNWLPTRMPIVIDEWRRASNSEQPASDPWTTIMTWNVFKGPVVYRGVDYGDKGAEFSKILELPVRTGLNMKLAVGGGKAPRELLKKNRWQIVSGPQVTRTADTYQSFVKSSRGEISIAKQIYVAMKTGWFSDRSACYLASGRPVVLQDTGFSKHLPVGEGLFAFNTPEGAINALQVVEKDYGKHSRVALDIAHEYFDSDRVLSKLMEEICV